MGRIHLQRSVIDNSRFDAVSSYISYMGKREGAQLLSHGHGLFGEEDDISIAKVMEKAAGYRGPVFSIVVSLRREDAERLGYENAQAWKNFLKSHIFDIAEIYEIKATNLHWYASFHDNADRPHIHLILYGSTDNPGRMLYERGTETAKIFCRDMFRMSAFRIYKDASESRQMLIEKFSRKTAGIDIDGIVFSAVLTETMKELKNEMCGYAGKKKYQYLKRNLKAKADSVIEKLCKEREISDAYELWKRIKQEKLNLYYSPVDGETDCLNDKLFYPLKNELINGLRNEDDYERLCRSLALSFLTLISSDAVKHSAGMQSKSEKITGRKERHKLQAEGQRADASGEMHVHI